MHLSTHTAQAWDNVPSGTRWHSLALRPPARYPDRASSRNASVVAAAPARTVTVPPTFLRCCPTPVGCPLTCAHTRGKSAPFSGGVMSPHGSTPLRPITGRPSLPPSSSTRCPIRSSCDSPCCPKAAGQRAYHVPQAEPSGWFRPRLYAGGTTSAPGEFGAPGPDHMPFGPEPDSSAAPRRARLTPFCSSTVGSSFVTTLGGASPGLALPPHPGPRPPWCWQSPCRLALSRPLRGVRVRCLGSFAPRRYQRRTSR